MKTITRIAKENSFSIFPIALVVTEENRNKISIRGTGFFISREGSFITNLHVYNEIPKEEIKNLKALLPMKGEREGEMNYKPAEVTLEKSDPENDVVLMKVVGEEKDFSHIADLEGGSNIGQGEEIAFVGYPLATELLAMKFGMTLNVNKSIISAVKRRQSDRSLHFFMVDTHINNGSSGSPVFSLETGRVVGIASGKIVSNIPLPDGKVIQIPANLGICRPIEYAKKLLN